MQLTNSYNNQGQLILTNFEQAQQQTKRVAHLEQMLRSMGVTPH